MNRLYILLILLTANGLSAQPIIESTDIQPGFGFTYEVITTVGDFQPGAAGENQVWDFSDVPVSEITLYTYTDPAEVPGGDLFPGVTHALSVNDGALNQFLTFNQDSSTYNGLAIELLGEVFATVFSDPLRQYVFPVQYQQSYEETYRVQSSEVSEEIGNLTSTVDGYGSIQLAFENMDNVLRIKREGETVSIQYDQEGNVVAQDTSSFLQYDYITPGLTIPVATLDIDQETGNNSITLWVGTSVNSVEDQVQSVFQIFPNPSTNGIIEIKTNFKSVDLIRVFDLSGKQLYSEQPRRQSDGVNIIDLSFCEAGVYLVQVESEGQVYSKKVILKGNL